MIYQTFAELYDEFFDPAMYQHWLDFVRQQVKQPNRPMLDLACGTGRLAVQLAKQGYDVTGLDLSTEMLALAAQHADEADVTLPLIEGNLLDLSELATYQTITCFDDSLNYLPDLGSLQEAFTQVSAHLPADGQFLFDVITPYQTDTVYPGYMYNYRDEDRAFMWTTYAVEDEPHAVEHDLSFFIWNVDKEAFDRVNELHHERTYPLTDYQQALQAAGFQHVQVMADFGQQPINSETTRWFFKCEK